MTDAPAKPAFWKQTPILVGGVVCVVLVVAIVVSILSGAWVGDESPEEEVFTPTIALMAGDYVSDADSGWRLMLSEASAADAGDWDGHVRMYSPTLKLYDGGKRRCRLVESVLEVEFKKSGGAAVVQMFDVVDQDTLGLKLNVAAFPGYMRRKSPPPAPAAP